MLLARKVNCKSLKYWALVSNISNMLRGGGRSAESVFTFFGHTLLDPTRHALFAKLTGNDKKGSETKNTLVHKWMQLFKTKTALILTYDNYQKGRTLHHQRGKHTSAFFKGTHQCGHKVILFEDDTFDACFVDFSQLEQVIPLPNKMPAFKIVDLLAPAKFFIE